MNEKMKKSQIALLKVEQRALDLGYVVSIPTIEGERYDCIIDIKGKLLRVQVKYAGVIPKGLKGAVHIRLDKPKGRGVNRPYTQDEIDILLVYIPYIDKLCWFNFEVFDGRNSLLIRYEKSLNGQKKGCLMANNYIWN